MDLRFVTCDLRSVPRCFVLNVGCVLMLSLFLCAGCDSSESTAPTPAGGSPATGETGSPERALVAPVTSGYAPVRIEVLPLTELTPSPGQGQGTQLDVYVSLLDAFGSQVKAPGTFRFELYDYVQRSAEPKGQQIAIWPDIDLTNPSENQKYWRDFLRAYQFTFVAQATADGMYILEATCMCSGGKRLSTDYALRPDN